MFQPVHPYIENPPPLRKPKSLIKDREGFKGMGALILSTPSPSISLNKVNVMKSINRSLSPKHWLMVNNNNTSSNESFLTITQIFFSAGRRQTPKGSWESSRRNCEQSICPRHPPSMSGWLKSPPLPTGGFWSWSVWAGSSSMNLRCASSTLAVDCFWRLVFFGQLQCLQEVLWTHPLPAPLLPLRTAWRFIQGNRQRLGRCHQELIWQMGHFSLALFFASLNLFRNTFGGWLSCGSGLWCGFLGIGGKLTLREWLDFILIFLRAFETLHLPREPASNSLSLSLVFLGLLEFLDELLDMLQVLGDLPCALLHGVAFPLDLVLKFASFHPLANNLLHSEKFVLWLISAHIKYVIISIDTNDLNHS